MDSRSLPAVHHGRGRGDGVGVGGGGGGFAGVSAVRWGRIAEVYDQTSRPRQGVCLALQCLPFGKACISNVIYYSGDVCPSWLIDEKVLFSKVLLPGK